MNDSQQKAITMGMFAAAALLIVLSLIRFRAYFEYRGKLDQAEALLGPEARESVHAAALTFGTNVSVVMPLLLILAAGALGYFAFKRLGDKA